MQSLNFPNWDTLLNTNDSSRTFYAVEGANKWALQGSSFKGGILTNLETGVVYDKNTSNINFNADGSLFFTESKDGRLWSIFSGVKWYDPKTDTAGELIIPDLVGNNHATLGRLKEILFGANENEIWITASNGVIYMKDGVFKYTISNSDSDIFLSLRQVKLDENNNLYALSDSGLATVSDVNNTSPTINEIKAFPTVSGVGPFFLSYRYLTIDNKGTKWLVKNHNLGYSSIIKFEDDNKGKGITNGALTSTLSTRVSGKAFLDINENGIFDEGLDEGIPNQTLNIKTNTKLVTVSTDNDGNYDFLVFLPNQIYEIAVPSTNGFDYTSDRIHKVSVTDLDVSYSKDIPFNRVDIEGLFVRGATKEGAWGFDRGGFDNNFITVVGNLSFAKTFTGVKLTYQFINTNKNREDYNNPSISSIKLFKVKNNVDDHIIDKIRIKSGREQDWYVNADETTYTKVELASPIFIETTEDKNLTLEIDLGDINPAEVYVLEIETEVFDPVAINDVIQFGPTAICATNFASSNLTVNQECIDISATSDDVRGGSHSDFSTYEEPEVIFEGEEDVTPDPKDVYTDGPFLVPIFSSYDPNDKLVSPGVPDRINETDIQKKWLTYTVRFQNNGNFSAKDVVVLDTIDVDFDRYSFRFIEASHKLKIEEVGTTLESIKKFKFENIFLPDSLSDPDGSQGYFKYSIKAKKDIPENTLVENTAYIYFDQNPAIITNTIQNNFKTPAVASVEKYALREELYLYPNPATSKVTISLSNNATIDKVEVYGILGDRIITQKGINKSKIEIDVSILSTGIYFIKANAEGKIISKKLLIK